MSRTIAIGDIHGCSLALDALLGAVAPAADDLFVTLGDYVNRGPGTRAVIERLIALQQQCRVESILGNHDQVLLEVFDGNANPMHFLSMGGAATLASYNAEAIDMEVIYPRHIAFLRNCRDSFETDTHLFVHAQYLSDLPMDEQPVYALRWEKLRETIPGPHYSGKRAVVGHSSQKSGEVLNLGHIVCIDTYCYGGGWLTAFDVDSGQVWQADRMGRLRSRRL